MSKCRREIKIWKLFLKKGKIRLEIQRKNGNEFYVVIFYRGKTKGVNGKAGDPS